MARPAETVSERRDLRIIIRRAIICATIFLIPIISILTIQYASYGTGLFLGWDTPTYVWWARQLLESGVVAFIRQGYPNMYVIFLAGFGAALGNIGLAERILPPIVSLPLALATYRLTSAITSDRRLGYFAVFLSAITLNTLRVFSDLNRNLLAYGLSLTVGALIASNLSSGNFDWWKRRMTVLGVWLPLLAVVAYTQIETYAVLSLALILLFLQCRRISTAVTGTLLVATPILVALPIITPFLLSYQTGLTTFARILPITFSQAFPFLGGYSMPWVGIGLFAVNKMSPKNIEARFILMWTFSLTWLSIPAFLIGVPLLRLAYIIPVPIIAASAVKPVSEFTHDLISKVGGAIVLGGHQLRSNMGKRTLVTIFCAAIVTSTFFTSIPASFQYIRPYVSQSDIDRIEAVAQIAAQLGYSQPILVIYGPRAADLSPIYRAYFGIHIPNSLAYYGKLQFLFTLPQPWLVYNWRYNPAFEQANSIKYRADILNQIGSSSNITSHAIIIAGGNTYGVPLSESFISQDEVHPGMYIIPPGQLSSQATDNWRLFAFSDWTATTAAYSANASWAQAPQILEYVGNPSQAAFEANYTISMSKSWQEVEMLVHYWDWSQPFEYSNGTNATLSPLQFYLDGNLILTEYYHGLGPSTIRVMLGPLNDGVHRLTILSGLSGLGVAVRLDQIQFCPLSC